jgi:membrane fusion protein (multidrug efflux system)
MRDLYMPLQKLCQQATILLPIVVALAGCGSKNITPTGATAPQVTVITAHKTSVPITIDLPGRTAPYLIAQVRARVDGIVQKRQFAEGGDVKVNQPLYQIDPAPYRAALDNAKAALQKAEANFAVTTAQLERYKTLVNGNAISKQTYDNAAGAQKQAAADVAAAKAAVATASINLGYTNVIAPISGVTGISQVTQGAYVQSSAATLLTTVQQIDPIYVDMQQSSVEGLQLRRDVANGQIKLDGTNRSKVSLVLEDGTEYPISGALEFNGTTVDPATGSVTVRAVFPNPKHVLLPGMFVHARVEEGTKDGAVLVPIASVTHDPQGQASYSKQHRSQERSQKYIVRC